MPALIHQNITYLQKLIEEQREREVNTQHAIDADDIHHYVAIYAIIAALIALGIALYWKFRKFDSMRINLAPTSMSKAISMPNLRRKNV